MSTVGYWVPYRKYRLNNKYKVLRQTVQMDPGVYEWTLVGLYGEIYENSDMPERKYKILFYSNRISAKYGVKTKQLVIPASDLDLWAQRLKVFKTWMAQLKMVNKLFGYASTSSKSPETHALPRIKSTRAV